MKHRDIRLNVTPEEVKLLHALLLTHVYTCIAKGDLEPFEAGLLARIGRTCNKCATSPLIPGEEK